jgi:hypothetical protein
MYLALATLKQSFKCLSVNDDLSTFSDNYFRIGYCSVSSMFMKSVSFTLVFNDKSVGKSVISLEHSH